MPIPVQNIYHLLSYAWDKPETAAFTNTEGGSEETEAPVNILANILLPEITALLAHGLATDFISATQTVRGIKGKLLLNATFRQNQLVPGQTVCLVAAPCLDIPPNQFIKAALLCLQQTADLAPTFAAHLKRVLAAFAQVNADLNSLGPTPGPPRHQTRRYGFILNCCVFIRTNLLPKPTGQGYIFPAFLIDKKQMGGIFEKFVRNFYRREQNQYRVKSEKLSWQGQGTTVAAQQYLPAMFTDISLQSATRKIIIDTKFYRQALQLRYQKEKLISKHLYQLFTYLHHSPKTKSNQAVEGLLLYPVVNQELNLEYTLSNYKIRICTINLNQPWPEIKKDLLQIIA